MHQRRRLPPADIPTFLAVRESKKKRGEILSLFSMDYGPQVYSHLVS
jgi:hypothetical protein